jgi:hypothetical protein
MKFRRGEYYLAGSASRELKTIVRIKDRVVPGMLSQDEINDGIEISMKRYVEPIQKPERVPIFIYHA